MQSFINEINEGIISLMSVKISYCPYKGSTWDTRLKIALYLSGVPLGYIWPYIRCLVLIWIQFLWTLGCFSNNFVNKYINACPSKFETLPHQIGFSYIQIILTVQK